MTNLIERIIRSAMLDVDLYKEVEEDDNALTQAIMIVVLSSIAGGIGSIGRIGISGIWKGTITILIGWFIWAYIVYYVGTKIIPGPKTDVDYKVVLRTIGFSCSPQFVRILGIIPVIGKIVFFVVSIWMLAAMVVAIKQVLKYENILHAVVVCLVGWLIQMLALLLVYIIIGGMMLPL